VPRAKAFEAISTAEGLRRWAEPHGEPAVDPRVGGTWDLGWRDARAAVIAAIEPPNRLAVDWPHGAGTTRVAFEFEEKSGDRCALHFAHEGFPAEENSPIVPLRCRWSDRLVALKNVVESGDTGFTEPYDEQVPAA
jgi:uncharacterized protein YndB with AHSA1/START domain